MEARLVPTWKKCKRPGSDKPLACDGPEPCWATSACRAGHTRVVASMISCTCSRLFMNRRGPRLSIVLCIGAMGLTACAHLTDPPAMRVSTIATEWRQNYTVNGVKTEPTYTEDIEYGRWGNRFAVRALFDGQLLGYTEIQLSDSGMTRVLACSRGLVCPSLPTDAYLVTVSFLSAFYRHALRATGRILRYRGRRAVCVAIPGSGGLSSTLGQPCLDVQTGAYLAVRFNGEFSGPMVDPWSLHLSLRADPSLFNIQ